jgi:enterochelin esterase-like enzyme
VEKLFMNVDKSRILLVFSTLLLFSCHYSPGVAAKSPTPENKQVASLLPSKLTTESLATPLTYHLETYHSQVMGGNRTYGVSLPPGYEQSSPQLYPVIFLIHGGHGDPNTWFDSSKGQALKTIEQLYTLGKLPPSIIITPDGNDKRGTSPYWDPQYIDGPQGKVVTAVGYELVKIVKNRYRTLPSPDFWAMGGLSSGGWGAMNIGLHSPYFSTLFSHSGYFRDRSGPANSPITYIKQISANEKKRLRIYLDSGTSDTEEIEEARQFTKVLHQLKVYYLFQKFPGSHTWQYWREHLTNSLSFVGEQFQFLANSHPKATPQIQQSADTQKSK